MSLFHHSKSETDLEKSIYAINLAQN